jgi:hypothetical protein
MTPAHFNTYEPFSAIKKFGIATENLVEMNDIFVKGIQFCVKPKELESDELRENMGPGRFYELKLLGMKSGWTMDPEHYALVEVHEDDSGDVRLPYPLAMAFREMSRSLVGRSVVVICEEDFELKTLKRGEWMRFKKEFWSAIVKRHKEGIYQNVSDQKESEKEMIMKCKELIWTSPCMINKEESDREMVNEKGFEPIDMRSFRRDESRLCY